MISFQPSHLVKNTSHVVYVSVCVRTWMTALLLYGRNCTHLKLIISPFIKEKGTDPGNMPEHNMIQFQKFKNLISFIKYLKQIKTDLTFECENVNITLHGFNYLTFTFDSIPTFEPKDGPAFKEYIKKLNPSTNHLTPEFPLVNEFVARKIPNSSGRLSGNGYTPEMTTFYHDGLLRFYAWVNVQKTTTWPIFVVSHNHQMQESLEVFLRNKSYFYDKLMSPLKKILSYRLKANGWTLHFKKLGID